MTKVKRILFIILILLALVLSAANFHDANVNLLFRSVQMPLVLVIVGNLAVGVLVGMVLGTQIQKGRQARRATAAAAADPAPPKS